MSDDGRAMSTKLHKYFFGEPFKLNDFLYPTATNHALFEYITSTAQRNQKVATIAMKSSS